MAVSSFQNFITEYYIDPITHGASYNPVNTLTWGILLGIAIFGVLKLLEKLRIEIDERFIMMTLPYMLVGSTLRVMEDADMFAPPMKYLFITPLIFFLIAAVCLAILLTLTELHKKGKIGDRGMSFLYVGAGWEILSLFILLSTQEITRLWVLLAVLGIATPMAMAVYLIARRFDMAWMKEINAVILWAHLFEATSTFIGVDFLGYGEKHVLSTFMIDWSGTGAVMYPLKLITILSILYIIDHHLSEEPKTGNLAKLAILMLGLAPGLRNTLRMMLGI
ncbi:MAG: DUF63 family protein [Methanocellales archaeon]|nr:DUF63 family protein [Methanocellales archaeon]MDD3291348.1 DUF63 family protein [Methanocellales archaeon]MDD5234762.1 DUF63 family protein [Methanocellales archaeon]MDD5484887.1 DUF63 family protein [Methanocellales archaeon]